MGIHSYKSSWKTFPIVEMVQIILLYLYSNLFLNLGFHRAQLIFISKFCTVISKTHSVKLSSHLLITCLQGTDDGFLLKRFGRLLRGLSPNTCKTTFRLCSPLWLWFLQVCLLPFMINWEWNFSQWKFRHRTGSPVTYRVLLPSSISLGWKRFASVVVSTIGSVIFQLSWRNHIQLWAKRRNLILFQIYHVSNPKDVLLITFLHV